LSDRNPLFLPLQFILAQQLLATGRMDAAADVATRAVHNFPTAVEPARLATDILVASQRWSEAREMAKAWRERSPGDTLPADLAAAEIAMQLHRPGDVAAQLQIYIPTLSDLDTPRRIRVLIYYARALAMTGENEKASQLLEPVLEKEPGARIAWAGVVADNLEPEQARQWLQRLDKLLAAGNTDERVALAEAWAKLGKRSAADSAVSEKMLTDLASRPDVTPTVVAALGALKDEQGDFKAAEEIYRRALTMKPDFAFVQNNLAMVLVRNGGDPHVALQLAEAASKAMPVPAVYDTLARAQANNKDLNASVDTLRICVRLDPMNPQRKANLASSLLQAHHREEAAEIVAALDATHIPALNQEPLRSTMDDLHKRLAAENAIRGPAKN
jgi:predicted Zn-dependent protease